MVKNIAIIPARGGSKRIFKKNIKQFHGKPIIEYVLKNVLDTKIFNEIIVSTDDEEILSIAKKNNIKVPFLRSEKNSNDHATTLDVLKEVLNHPFIKKKNFINAMCIYPTSVLIHKNIIEDTFELFTKKNYKSLITIKKYLHPIQRAIKLNDNYGSFINSENHEKRTQDFESYYHDAGQLYWFKVSELENKDLFKKEFGTFLLSEFQSQDIDNIEDWKLAEIKFNLKKDNYGF